MNAANAMKYKPFIHKKALPYKKANIPKRAGSML